MLYTYSKTMYMLYTYKMSKFMIFNDKIFKLGIRFVCERSEKLIHFYFGLT